MQKKLEGIWKNISEITVGLRPPTIQALLLLLYITAILFCVIYEPDMNEIQKS
jgi:hypothetical protein